MVSKKKKKKKVFTDIEVSFSAGILRLRLVGGDASRNGAEFFEIEADFSAKIVTFRLVGGDASPPSPPPKSATGSCSHSKLGISKFYELLSEPQTNQPQFITECSHCICKYPLLLQTFKTCDCSRARRRAIGRVVELLCSHVAFVLVWISRFEYHQGQQLFYN